MCITKSNYYHTQTEIQGLQQFARMGGQTYNHSDNWFWKVNELLYIGYGQQPAVNAWLKKTKQA